MTLRPAGPARLTARPRAKIADPLPAGLQALGLGSGRDGALYVPANLPGPAALVVMLHGAGGEARRALNPFLDQADDEGLVLLAGGLARPDLGSHRRGVRP